MAVQLPPLPNKMNVAAIDQAAQQHEWNALRNEQTKYAFSEDQRIANTKWAAAASQQGLELMQQNPESFRAFMPNMIAEGQRRGVWQDFPFDPATASSEEAMVGLQNMNQDMMMGLAGQPDPLTKNDIVGVHGEDGPEYVRPSDALGERPYYNPTRAPQIPAKIQQAEWWMKAGPKQRAGYMQANYAGSVKDINGVPTWVFPGGEQMSLTTIDEESAGQSRIAADVAGSQATARGASARDQEFIDVGQRQADATAVIRRGIQLLDVVGTGRPGEIALAARNLFGIAGADETELNANLGKAILSQLRTVFGAQFTAGEGERLEYIEANFGKSTEGNRRLLQQALKIMERAARRGIEAATRAGDEFAAKEIQDALDFTLEPLTESGGSRMHYDTEGRRIE